MELSAQTSVFPFRRDSQTAHSHPGGEAGIERRWETIPDLNILPFLCPSTRSSPLKGERKFVGGSVLHHLHFVKPLIKLELHTYTGKDRCAGAVALHLVLGGEQKFTYGRTPILACAQPYMAYFSTVQVYTVGVDLLWA